MLQQLASPIWCLATLGKRPHLIVSLPVRSRGCAGATEKLALQPQRGYGRALTVQALNHGHVNFRCDRFLQQFDGED